MYWRLILQKQVMFGDIIWQSHLILSPLVEKEKIGCLKFKFYDIPTILFEIFPVGSHYNVVSRGYQF